MLWWKRWRRLLRVGRGRALGHSGNSGLRRPPSLSWFLIICEINTRGQLASPHRLLSSDFSPHSTPSWTANRIKYCDHLPSSAPPKSPLCSGERLRLTPRGLVFGAMTVFDDAGSTGTRKIMRQRQLQLYRTASNYTNVPMTGSPRVAVAGTSPIKHPIRHPSEIYVEEKYKYPVYSALLD